MLNYELKRYLDKFVSNLRKVQPLPKHFLGIIDCDHVPGYDLVTRHLVGSFQLLLMSLIHFNHQYLQIMTLKIESRCVRYHI